MIELKQVSKKYGNHLAVDNVSFSVKSGEIIGLLGVNGAGKTTIMKMITGYHNPHAGEVIVCGHNVLLNPVEVKKRVGYLPETNPLYDDLLVMEYLVFIAEARKIEKAHIKETLSRVSKQCSLQEFMYKPISDLSKGMRQRVGLAQALLHNPDILILDEPTSGLDPNQIKEIRSVIREIGKSKAVILSTHILQEVEAMCDRVLIVNKGKIVAEGTDKEIASQLKGKDTYIIEVVGASSADIAEQIKTIDGVKEVSVNVEKDKEHSALDIMRVEVSAESSLVKGEDIFEWALKKKLKLRSLYKNSASLESIFESLTSSDMASIKEGETL